MQNAQKDSVGQVDAVLKSAWSRTAAKLVRGLCFRYGLTFPAPGVIVSEELNASRHGYYSHLTGTITLAASVFRRPWDVVDQLIRHELAHAVSHHLYGPNFPAHGEQFAACCRKVGLMNPVWHRSRGEMARDLDLLCDCPAGVKAERSQLDRVKKLLAMADSGRSSENEAKIALQKANELIRRHNIDLLAGESDGNGRQYAHRTIDLGTKRVPFFQKMIWSILRDHFFVQTCTEKIYAAETDEYRTGITFIGDQDSLETALFIFSFLHRECEILFNRRKTALQGGKNQYLAGLMIGFKEKLDTEEKERIAKARAEKANGFDTMTDALVIASDPGVNAYFAARFPKTRKSGKSCIKATSALHQGKQDGRKIVLRHGIKEEAGKRGLMIAHG